jgi:hypothetical protein
MLSINTKEKCEKLVKSTFFNILIGRDPSGTKIYFDNDYGSSNVGDKQINAKTLDELIEEGTNKLIKYTDTIPNKIMSSLQKNVKITNDPTDKYHFKLIYGYYTDRCNKEDLKESINNFIYENCVRNITYEILTDILPIWGTFGGDLNGSLFFESDIEYFVEDLLPYDEIDKFIKSLLQI